MADGAGAELEGLKRDRLRVRWEPVGRPTPGRSRRWVNSVLFVATVYTTTVAGMHLFLSPEDVPPDLWPWSIYFRPEFLAKGLPFSLPLLAVLGIHEMGHYLAAHWSGVRATLPYFIPIPPPWFIGTAGAVIKIKSRIPDRTALVDIGAAGPLAGFVVSVVALAFGLWMSEVAEVSGGLLSFGDSLVTSWLGGLFFDSLPEGHDVMIHPIGLAGWLGLFVTFLNLLPVGQFDGGHVVYAMFGARWHRLISKATLVVLGVFCVLAPPFAWIQAHSLKDMGVAWAASRWWGWVFWIALVKVFFGLRHPPPVDPVTALSPGRRAVGYLALLVLVICFIPRPISFTPP